jgi:hypothetical protein
MVTLWINPELDRRQALKSYMTILHCLANECIWNF